MRHLPIPALCLAVAALSAGEAAAQDDLVMQGAREYREACAVCHGEDGRGDGAMAGILNVPPPDLATLAERNGGRFPFERVFRVIDGRESVAGHGTADMPVWGRTFQQEARQEGGAILGPDPDLEAAGRVYALAKYLRAIQGGREVPTPEPRRPARSWPEDIPRWEGPD